MCEQSLINFEGLPWLLVGVDESDEGNRGYDATNKLHGDHQPLVSSAFPETGCLNKNKEETETFTSILLYWLQYVHTMGKE